MIHYILFFTIFTSEAKIVKQIDFYAEETTYKNYCKDYMLQGIELLRETNPKINLQAGCKQLIIL